MFFLTKKFPGVGQVKTACQYQIAVVCQYFKFIFLFFLSGC